MSDTPLGEILDSEEEPIAEVETTEAAERLRDEHGRFASKTGEETATEEVVESVTPTPEAEPNIPIAALKDERQKRQNLEAQLKQYEDFFQQLGQPKEPELDEETQQIVDALAQRLMPQVMQQVQPAVHQQGTLTRAEVSEMLARQKYEDYDAKIEVFKEAVQGNPFLLQQVQNAPDPATFAYNAAVKYEEAKHYGTAAPTRDQIEAEIREKIMSEIGLKSKVPTTLAGDRSVGSRSGPAWTGPTPLGDILSR